MLVFSRTMRALFEGTQEVLEEVADIPRAARRRLDSVDKRIKERHKKRLREITDGLDDDFSEQD